MALPDLRHQRRRGHRRKLQGSARTSDTNDAADTAADTNTAVRTPDTNDTANTAAAVPDFDMIDLHTGAAVSLRSAVNGETPLLFWFWDPL